MEHGFVFDLDPTLLRLGPLQLRYYGIIFASMLYTGFIVWRWQMLRARYSQAAAENFLIWGVVAVLGGARLGHCFFYEPDIYLKNPITILYVWQGGLSSHGATIGIVLTLILYARKYRLPLVDLMDRMAMPAAIGAAAVRLGNFFNSEIVGRATDVPWAVRFMRYDQGAVARHPSQLYEFFLGAFVFVFLYVLDKKAGEEKRPKGLLAAAFFILYFFGRFMVEFVKEYQVENLAPENSYLTTGQYLSVIPCLFGFGMLYYALTKGKAATLAAAAKMAAMPAPAHKIPAKMSKKKGRK